MTDSSNLDLNLLVTLDALLSEGSVVGAAQRMNLSAPAMSRQLRRIRHTLGDPILVRAGRGLVPTPRALAMRDRLRRLIQEAGALVRGDRQFELSALDRTFNVRASDGFVASFGPALMKVIAKEAPAVRLRFAPQGNEDVDALRDGHVDLDIGVIDTTAPEVRLQALIHDRYVGVVRSRHTLARKPATVERFLAFPHISVSRRGRFEGPIDAALAKKGLKRTIVAAVANFADAIALVRSSDCIAAVPQKLTSALCSGLVSFDLPVKTDAIVVSMAWHPRFDADPAQRWFRSSVRGSCQMAS